MKEIYDGLRKAHKPGEADGAFSDAIYGLFNEYKNAYQTEWNRLNSNEKMYKGDHWHDIPTKNDNEPRPTTPIIFSTIENVRADLTDEYPEAIIKPEGVNDEVLSKVLTAEVASALEACDYDKEFDNLTHDLLVGGYMVQEVGWDATMNRGMGGAFIRHQSNKNVMFDPLTANIQDGRAIFKIDRKPASWFEMHYPEHYPFMKADAMIVNDDHFEDDSAVEDNKADKNYFLMIEVWIRMYDAETRRYSVHMVKLSGGQVLENSYDIKPEGYYYHGMYPFIVTPLYEIKGSALGLGIVDMFNNTQKYSDKIDQIMLENALMSGKNKALVRRGAVDNINDLTDFSKDVVEVDDVLSTIMWVQAKPLPSYIFTYMKDKFNTIKEESGSNDFSRGNTTSGVTAASAITALQEMSSKRSRLEARRIHYGFKQAVRMMVETNREFDVRKHSVDITVNGEPVSVVVNKMMYDVGGNSEPIEYRISIKPVRETKFSKMANNELILQFCAMFQGQVDPAILMEAMDFQGKELVFEKLRAAQGKGFAAMQQQIEQLTQIVQQMGEENEKYKQALASAQSAIVAAEDAQKGAVIPDTLAVS